MWGGFVWLSLRPLWKELSLFGMRALVERGTQRRAQCHSRRLVASCVACEG